MTNIKLGTEYVVGRQNNGRPIVRVIHRLIGTNLVVDIYGIRHARSAIRCCPPSYRLSRKSIVVIRKPNNGWDTAMATQWVNGMDEHDGQVLKLKSAGVRIEADAVYYNGWAFSRDWLVPV